MLTPSLILAAAIALTLTPLVAVTVAGLGSTAARAMGSLTEPGSLLVWGTLLAGLARAVGHWRHKV